MFCPKNPSKHDVNSNHSSFNNNNNNPISNPNLLEKDMPFFIK